MANAVARRDALSDVRTLADDGCAPQHAQTQPPQDKRPVAGRATDRHQRHLARHARRPAMSKAPKGDNLDPKLRLIRQGMSSATDRYSIGGILKKGGHAPRPITLPTLKFTGPEGPQHEE